MQYPKDSKCEMENIDKIIHNRLKTMEYQTKLYKHKYKEAISNGRCSVQVESQCYQCCGNDKDSVLNCQGYSCPLYFIRPEKFHDTEAVRKLVYSKEPKETWGDGANLQD